MISGSRLVFTADTERPLEFRYSVLKITGFLTMEDS